jgi:hypothetical protein
MFARHALLSVMLVLCLVSGSAFASSNDRISTGVDLILNAMNSAPSGADMIQQIVVGIRAQGECKESSLPKAQSVAACMRGTLERGWYGRLDVYLDAAVQSGKLDKVERAVLRRLFTAITSIRGNTAEGVIIANAPLMGAPGGNGIPQPSLFQYRANKAAFEALRKAKKMDAILPNDLVKEMAKTYPRKMNGVGNITTEQYFAAQLNRLQLNVLAGLMISATDFMTRPDAKVVFYPANHVASSAQIQKIERQELDLAQQIAVMDDDAQRASLRAELQALDAQLSTIRGRDPVDQLRTERGVLNDRLHSAIQTLAQIDLDDQGRAALADQMKTTIQQIGDVDDQLAKLIRTEDLPPEDVQRFAMNALKQDFHTLIQDAPFNSLRLQTADVLLAAWVAGDLSSDALKALTQLSTFHEVHESVWKKALEIGWMIGKSSLMAYPTTSYIAIAISVLLEVRASQKAATQEKSDETHLIPAQR